MAYRLKCPDCSGKFSWNPEADMPRFCPLCQADMGEMPDDNVVCLPAFLSAATKSVDKVYTDIVRGSETRVELAAQAAGCDPSEMSALKITDLNTRKDAEIMAKEVVNPVTQHMATMNAQGGQFGFQGNGAAYAGDISSGAVVVNGQRTTGIAPRAGASALASVQRLNGRG